MLGDCYTMLDIADTLGSHCRLMIIMDHQPAGGGISIIYKHGILVLES